jgi:hypothetical protein
MGHLAVLLGVLLLVVAGCSGGDDAPAAATTQSPATTQPAAESTTSLSSAEEAVDATVVYEPGDCKYFGPAVFPLGSTVTFEFDAGGHAVFFVVGLVIDGTTREEIIEYGETHDGTGGMSFGQLEPPYYLVGPGYLYLQESAGSMVVEFSADGDWTVDCITTPESTDRAYLAGMIKVIEG